MTVASQTSRVSYSGDGTSTEFAVPFYFLEDSHLRVVLLSAAGVETEQDLGTDYTVTGAGESAGGEITMSTAPASGETLTILRNVPFTQQTDYQANDPFPAESHERALDKLTMVAQQSQEQLDRVVVAPVSESGSNLQLPPIAARSGKYLAFNESTGDPEAGPSVSDVDTVSGLSTDIALLADIEDGTIATNAITAVSGISTNVTTVAGIASNVTTVANDQADIGTVAANLNGSDTIGTVAGSIANVNATGSSIADVNTVAGELGAGQDVTVVAADLSGTDTIGTVAGSIADVNTVAGEIGAGQDVTVVAANIADVGTVATDIANVNTTATNIANVNTTASISADVTTVAGISADVTSVSNNSTNINSVASNITDVAAVGGIEEEIDFLANDITGGNFAPGVMYDLGSITDAAEGIPGVPNGYIVTVFNSLDDIIAVSDINGNVSTVAGIASDVTTVAGVSANVTTVAGISSNVTSVANISANVTTVAGIDSDVTSVAGIAANVTTAADNIAAIQNAPQAATDAANARDKAQDWAQEAEDVEVEPGQFSAFHWAQKAQDFAEGDATAISYDGTTSGLSATNVQAAIDEVVNETASLSGGNTFTGNQTITGDVTITGTVDLGSIA